MFHSQLFDQEPGAGWNPHSLSKPTEIVLPTLVKYIVSFDPIHCGHSHFISENAEAQSG